MTKTFKDIQEAISSSQLAGLKKHYEPLRKIDMSKHKDQVKKTTVMLNKLDPLTLQSLSREDIPVISDVAKSILKRFNPRLAESVRVNQRAPEITLLSLNFRDKRYANKALDIIYDSDWNNNIVDLEPGRGNEIDMHGIRDPDGLIKMLKQRGMEFKGAHRNNSTYDSQDEKYESVDEAVDIKALAKKFRKNEDENRHTENYLMLAKAFGSRREIMGVEAIIRRNKRQGHTNPEDSKWMATNIGKYFHKIRAGESVEESRIMGLNKWSAEYKAGKAAAKKGEKYDANPHAPGVKRLNWSTGHNDFRADNLRKAGKPNYGARGQFEELIREADLTKSQIKMVHDKADELPKQDFIKRYGKDGDAVRFATATNIVKKKLGIED